LSAAASPQTPLAGAYSALPDPLAVFRGPTSKGSGEERRGGEKRGGEGEDMRGGEGKERVRPLP